MEPLPDVTEFLKTNDGFELTPNNRKIRCKLTGHEMPCDITVLNNYISGKKYQRLTGKGSISVNQTQKFMQYLEPLAGKREKLFCLLTRKTISNTPACIERHVQGKRFKKALEKASSTDSHDDPKDTGHIDCMESDEGKVLSTDMEMVVEERLENRNNTETKKTIKDKKKTNKTKNRATGKPSIPFDEGSEEGEEDLESGTIVLWVPSDHEFEEEEEDPWASYFEHLQPTGALPSHSKAKSKSTLASNGVGQSRKRKSNQSFELSHDD